MNKGYLTLVFLLLLILVTCCTTSKNTEKIFFQKNINTLLDSAVFDRRRLVVPSPQDFKDSLSRSKLMERANLKMNLNLSPLHIILLDSIKPISNLNDFFSKIKYFKSELDYKAITEEDISAQTTLKIELSKFEIDSSKYTIISHTDFKKGLKLLGNQKLERNPPICSLSSIYFNKEENLGAFKMSIVYSGLDGHGVIVFIKKENGNWVIDKIIEDWIA
ncbi:hypothetical protein [Psychroserpens damuponensis]|uniref:hypothetical protein n=1 Tax=Psychroserpens damuponensis TaxID=943936 RepID=UPI00058DD2D7|nr:hypothetical protein [Psychroserpens damuponensis]